MRLPLADRLEKSLVVGVSLCRRSCLFLFLRQSTVDWLAHSDQVLEEICGVCSDLTRYLTLPSFTRARHKVTQWGCTEAEHTRAVANALSQSIVVRFAQLSSLCEILKREGMPGNEASRVRQWEHMLLEHTERLYMIKTYRTPQGLRSFSRLFSVFLPPFYAPYYAQMAKDLNSLGAAITFSVLTSLALTSLFETVSQMEDPFVKLSVLDGVRVKTQLLDGFEPQLLAMRKCYFPQAAPFEPSFKTLRKETNEQSLSLSISAPNTLATMRIFAE